MAGGSSIPLGRAPAEWASPLVGLCTVACREGASYRAAPKWLIETLFASVAATLKDFAGSPRWMGVKGGQAAFSLVLHTWSQNLAQHLHLHAVMACGVLAADGQWQGPVRKLGFLFPVRVLRPLV